MFLPFHSIVVSYLSDDLAEGFQVYTHQPSGQGISSLNATLDGDLCNWLEVGLPGCSDLISINVLSQYSSYISFL